MANLQDIDFYGKINADGSLTEYYDKDAVRNALTLWLNSKRGEFLYNPSYGGLLDRALFKNLTTSTLQQILLSLFDGIEKWFSPQLEIEDIRMEPDYENRILAITIVYINTLDGNQDEVTIYTKDISQYEHKEYQSIEYSGNNLEEFVKLQKVDMKGKLLEFNMDHDKWIWGQYIFENFNHDSSNFATILTLCNLT